MRGLNLTLVLAAACTVLASPAALGQSLDGMWLKLRVKADGISVDNRDDSVRSKGAFRGWCYMLIEYDSRSNAYSGDTACETARGVWSQTSSGPSFTRFSDEGGYAFEENAHYTNRQGQVIEGAGTHLLTPVYNRGGELVRAKLQSYGELSGNSSLEPGVTHLVGGYTVVGSSLPSRRVPSDVIALLEDDVADAPPDPDPDPAPDPGSGVANEMLALVNAERAAGAECGGNKRPAVAPLRLDPSLSHAASRHALDMASNDFFSHTGSDNSSPFQRIAAAGFSGSPQGENIAAGYRTAASAMAGWMSSAGHCNNIMDADFEFLGVDHAFNANSEYGHYWVQSFGGS
jgi:uncharacterized protein YkwD